MKNLFLWSAAVLVTLLFPLSSLCLAAKAPGEAATHRQESNRSLLRQPAATVKMPDHRLTVRVQGDNGLGGRKVTIAIRNGRLNRSQTVSLNAAGDAAVTFPLGSVPAMAHGDYTINVTKGPADPSHYASTANYCFDGTSPAVGSAHIDSAHRQVTVGFTLRASIAWNRQGYCW